MGGKLPILRHVWTSILFDLKSHVSNIVVQDIMVVMRKDNRLSHSWYNILAEFSLTNVVFQSIEGKGNGREAPTLFDFCNGIISIDGCVFKNFGSVSKGMVFFNNGCWMPNKHKGASLNITNTIFHNNFFTSYSGMTHFASNTFAHIQHYELRGCKIPQNLKFNSGGDTMSLKSTNLIL